MASPRVLSLGSKDTAAQTATMTPRTVSQGPVTTCFRLARPHRRPPGRRGQHLKVEGLSCCGTDPEILNLLPEAQGLPALATAHPAAYRLELLRAAEPAAAERVDDHTLHSALAVASQSLEARDRLVF